MARGRVACVAPGGGRGKFCVELVLVIDHSNAETAPGRRTCAEADVLLESADGGIEFGGRDGGSPLALPLATGRLPRARLV